MFDSGTAPRPRQTATYKLNKLTRSGLWPSQTIFTIEKEYAFLGYLRNTRVSIAVLVFAQCSIVPVICVVQVKSFLVWVDLVAECENDAQIL